MDSVGAHHGFVRTKSGKITSFDAPGAGTSSGEGTFAWRINTAGDITGYLMDSSGVYHGFVNTP